MMDHSESDFSPIIIENSTVEFIIVGSHDGRDKVVVKSANAGLDLIGVAAESRKEPFYSATSSLMLSLFGSAPRHLNLVTSYPVDDFDLRSDTRQSTMKFAWVGDCSGIREESIGEAFKQSVPDLRQAIQDSNLADLEWSISPVILRCVAATQRRMRLRRFFYTSLAIYAIAALLAVAYAITRDLFKL